MLKYMQQDGWVPIALCTHQSKKVRGQGSAALDAQRWVEKKRIKQQTREMEMWFVRVLLLTA